MGGRVGGLEGDEFGESFFLSFADDARVVILDGGGFPLEFQNDSSHT